MTSKMNVARNVSWNIEAASLFLTLLMSDSNDIFDFEIDPSENNSVSLIINGRLAVKSVVGQGTEFTVDPPIWKEREIRRRP